MLLRPVVSDSGSIFRQSFVSTCPYATYFSLLVLVVYICLHVQDSSCRLLNIFVFDLGLRGSPHHALVIWGWGHVVTQASLRKQAIVENTS